MREHQRGHQHPGGGAGGDGEEARALGDAAAVDRRQVSGTSLMLTHISLNYSVLTFQGTLLSGTSSKKFSVLP